MNPNERTTVASESGKLEGWCIVQQMGHRTLIGEVKQIQMGDVALLRIDIPAYVEEVECWNEDGKHVVERRAHEARFEIISPASIYAIAPVTKEVAIEKLPRGTTPTWAVPKLLTSTLVERRLLTDDSIPY